MRLSMLIALSAMLLLVGCNSSNPPPPPPAPKIASTVSGKVLLREPRELSTEAKLDVRVVDVAQPGLVLAQTTVSPANEPPIAFSMPIDVAKVDPRRTYAVEAMLIDGERRYLPVLQHPVLTHGAPSVVDIIVAPEATPAEKMYDEFKKAFAQIGGMKSINGSALLDKSSVAWDAFLKNNKVMVVREITDLDQNKGRITYKIAYQNDKPWVVQKEESESGSSRPFATTKVGWDENGQIVLRQRVANGQNAEVSDEDAKAIYQHAEQALATAKAKVPKK